MIDIKAQYLMISYCYFASLVILELFHFIKYYRYGELL
jgi:hypothetical protein